MLHPDEPDDGLEPLDDEPDITAEEMAVLARQPWSTTPPMSDEERRRCGLDRRRAVEQVHGFRIEDEFGRPQ